VDRSASTGDHLLKKVRLPRVQRVERGLRTESKSGVQIPGMPTGDESRTSATPRPTRWKSTSEASATSS